MRRLGVLLVALAASAAQAEVADSSPSGFTVKVTLDIHAAPSAVYQKLMRDVGAWWSPDNTFSHNSHNLSIEEQAQGCFCEKLPDGGGVRHMEVVYVAPGKALVMTGALGPLQSLAATGSMTIALTPASGGTKLDVSYAVAGYVAAGMNTWAAPVNTVVTEQFTRLKNYVERGDPAAK